MSDSQKKLGDKEQGFSLLLSALAMTLGPSCFGYASDDFSAGRLGVGFFLGAIGHVVGSAFGRWLDERR